MSALGGTGKGEMVRQERTAEPVTASAGQTPPPARPRSWCSARALTAGRSLAGRQSRLATVGQDKWPPPVRNGGIQNSAYRPTLFAF